MQALRFCGLLDESVAAHERATALDPTIVTSVPHTHFLRCEYEATLDTYAGTRYYLDAAAWAALGDTSRATHVLRERLAAGQLSPLMAGLMGSLLAILDSRRDEAVTIMTGLEVERDPEIIFYLARHFSMVCAASDSIRLLQRARAEGLASSHTLARDEPFAPLRDHDDFQRELDQARIVERGARRALERTAVRME